MPFRTLELGASVSYDNAALTRLIVRAAVARGAAPESIKSYTMGGAGDGWGRYTVRVWWEPPSRWRDEQSTPGGVTSVSVVREDATLIYLPMQRLLYTSEPVARDSQWEIVRPPRGFVEMPTIANRNAVFPLLRPPLPASEWVFATIAEDVLYAGRAARRVRATRRAGVALPDEVEASGYWSGVDEYECLVDDALQILLRLTAIADGVPVGFVSADDVCVDAPFPADTFTFVPPPGTRIAHIALST